MNPTYCSWANISVHKIPPGIMFRSGLRSPHHYYMYTISLLAFALRCPKALQIGIKAIRKSITPTPPLWVAFITDNSRHCFLHSPFIIHGVTCSSSIQPSLHCTLGWMNLIAGSPELQPDNHLFDHPSHAGSLILGTTVTMVRDHPYESMYYNILGGERHALSSISLRDGLWRYLLSGNAGKDPE